VFEKRQDHGTRRIVSVPVPETSFFLRAADGRKGRDAKRDAYERHSRPVREKERRSDLAGETRRERERERTKGVKRDGE